MIAVIYNYDSARDDLRLELRPKHRETLQTLVDAGQLVAGAAWKDGTGALLLFRGDDAEACLKALEQDPYLKAGVIAQRQAHQWSPALGSLNID